MTDYTELVKSLRTCGTDGHCELCAFNAREEYGDCDNRMMLAAADAIEDLISALTASNDVMAKYREQIPKWIPVTERLPEEMGRYIVLLKASEDETKRWIEWEIGDDADVVLEMFYDADQKIWKTEVDAYNAILSVVDREHDSCVTHWMPLPPPPQEGEAE